MADTKISALSSASALAGTEVLPIVQSAATVKATAAQVATYTESVRPKIPYGSGKYYPSVVGVPGAGSALGDTTIKLVPFCLPGKATISTVAVRVTTAGTGLYVGVWAADPATGEPTGAPLAYTSAIDVTTGTNGAAPFNVSAALNANVTLEAGKLYYWGLLVNATTNLQALSTTHNQGAFLAGGTLAEVANNSTTGGTNLAISRNYSAGINMDVTAGSFTRETAVNRWGIVYFLVA